MTAGSAISALMRAAAAMSLLFAGVAPAAAQMETLDPDRAIDGDLRQGGDELPPVSRDAVRDPYADPYDSPVVSPPEASPVPGTSYPPPEYPTQPYPAPQSALPPAAAAHPSEAQPAPAASADRATFQSDDLIGAAEGVFGKGAEGLARLIEDIIHEQGHPNAYITGREAGAAFGLGVRYGSGTMHHKVEGEHKVYWTGPSIGFDAGANAASTFVLVYNLWDGDELYERFPSGEGQAYLVGGFNASYLRKGDVVLVPIRMGVGVRLGVNAGYMKFSRQQRWLPF